jgi:hypothetical protein
VLNEPLDRLEEARATGDPETIGGAHLAVVAALGEEAAEAGAAGQADLYGPMIAHADEAVRAFEGAGPGWRLAEAHLLKAALLAHRAQGEDVTGEDLLPCVTGALDHCHRATVALQEAGELRYVIVADWHAAVSAVLLSLRGLLESVEDEEPRRVLDDVLTTYSEILGVSLVESLERRSEGVERLFAARLLGVLADAEADAGERQEMAAAARALASEALPELQAAGDLALGQEAYHLSQESTMAGAALACGECGHANLPGSSFCVRCGARLRPAVGDAGALARAVFCPACGKQSAPGKRFCTQCGARLRPEEEG